MAIAQDSTTTWAGDTGTSVTRAHTSTGSNLYGIALVQDQEGNTVTGVTWVKGGSNTAMSQLAHINRGPDNTTNYEIYMYGIYSPDTGAQNVIATRSGTVGDIRMCTATVTGAKQSAQPNAIKTQAGGSTGSPQSDTITTTVDGCGIFAFCFNDNGGVTASTNLTTDQSDVGTIAILAHSTTFPQVTAGAFTGTWTQNGIGSWCDIFVAIEPAPATTNNGAGFFLVF